MSGEAGEPLLGEKGRLALRRFAAWRLPALLLGDDGRIGRKTFWLFLGAVMLAAGAIFFTARLRQSPLVHVAFAVILLYPSYCVFSKRLQDMGVDGAWAIAVVAISALDLVLAASGLKSRPGRLAIVMTFWEWTGIANMAFVLGILGFWPGTQGANRFGLRTQPW